MSLPRVPKMQQRARKTQALEALTHLRPLLRARRNHKKYLQNGFFSGLLKPQTKLAQDRSAFDARRPRSTSFVAGADSHSGTLTMEAAQTANQSVLLTTAHTG